MNRKRLGDSAAMSQDVALAPVVAIARAWAATATNDTGSARGAGSSRVKVFLECTGALADYVRSQLDFVTFVSDRRQADVRVSVTMPRTRGLARILTVAFIGMRGFEGIEAMARVGLSPPRPPKSRRRDLPDPDKSPGRPDLNVQI